MKRPWKATKIVKMNARKKSSSTSITKTPMIQVMPITTVRDSGTEAFNQFLEGAISYIDYDHKQPDQQIISNPSFKLPNLLSLSFMMLSVLVSILDKNSHYIRKPTLASRISITGIMNDQTNDLVGFK